MKEFDLEKAKAGAPVCTRDGHKARIICFDKKGKYPIVALIDNIDQQEDAEVYTLEGCYDASKKETDLDLMMAPVKKTGWINIYKNKFTSSRIGTVIYATREEAEKVPENDENYIATTKIKWEE